MAIEQLALSVAFFGKMMREQLSEFVHRETDMAKGWIGKSRRTKSGGIACSLFEARGRKTVAERHSSLHAGSNKQNASRTFHPLQAKRTKL